MDVFIGMAKPDSTYELAEMLSDINAWGIITLGLAIFVIWSIVLNMTTNAYKHLCADKANATMK